MGKMGKRGITLQDTIIAIIMVSLVVIGAGNLKYYAVRDIVRSERQLCAARTATMLLESWKGNGADELFSPETSLGSIITLSASDVNNYPADYNCIGSHNLEIDDVAQNLTLSYKDLSSDLRALNVVVTYNLNINDSNDTSSFNDNISLTTYCRK